MGEHEWDDNEMSGSESEEEDIVPIAKKAKVVREEGISMKKEQKKNTKGTTKTNENKNDKRDLLSTTIYIGHLPKNFEEKELYTFLSQFGDIEALRVSRSYKTGHTRGYAFVKFDTTKKGATIEESSKVANIVAETLNGYLLGNKRLVCDVIPTNQMHAYFKMFKNDKKSNLISHNNPQKAMRRKIIRIMNNQGKFWNDDHKDKRMKNMMKRDNHKRKELSRLGIDYELPDIVDYSAQVDSASTPSQQQKRKEPHNDADDHDDMKTNKVEDKTTPKSNKKKKTEKDTTPKVDKEKESSTNNTTPKSNKKQKKKKSIESSLVPNNQKKTDKETAPKEEIIADTSAPKSDKIEPKNAPKEDVNVANKDNTPKSNRKQRKKKKSIESDVTTNNQKENEKNITSKEESIADTTTPKSNKKESKNAPKQETKVAKKDNTPKSNKKKKKKSIENNNVTTTK